MAATKNLVERNSFVMRTSEGFQKPQKRRTMWHHAAVPMPATVEIPPLLLTVRAAWKTGSVVDVRKRK
jgi:hypothetical protein